MKGNVFNLIGSDLRRMVKDKPALIIAIINVALVLLIFLCFFALSFFELSIIGLEIFNFSDSSLFTGAAFSSLSLGQVGFMLALAICIFTGRDFNHNTIRNKIIVGNSRAKIYLSSAFVNAILGLVFYIGTYVLSIIFGLLFFMTPDPIWSVTKVMLLCIPVYLSIIAIVTFICYAVKSRSLGIIINIIVLTVLPTIFSILMIFGSPSVAKALEITPFYLIEQNLSYASILGPAATVLDGMYILKLMLVSVFHTCAFTGLGVLVFSYSNLK